MTERNDGGQAFPTYVVDTDSRITRHLGMSLRDYFAGQAMRSSFNAEFAQEVCNQEYSPEIADLAIMNIAIFSYRIADAMLAERDKHPPNWETPLARDWTQPFEETKGPDRK